MTTLREAIARAIYTATEIRRWVDAYPEDIAEAYDRADAALAAIEAAGWQCVPKEPTRKMALAANDVELLRTTDIEGREEGTFWVTFGEFEEMWELALAAAPKP